jgi:prevent-host-death family protein
MPMRIINIREAKAQLSRLVEKVARGEAFVIAKAGKPLVKVTALDMPVGGSGTGSAFWLDRSRCQPISTGLAARTWSNSSTVMPRDARARHHLLL